jgi:hypothetical protein
MKSEKGQSLVEFALLLPVLLLLIFGILDFGRILHAYISIDHAGREAARAVSVDGLNANGMTLYGETINNYTELAQVVASNVSSINLEYGDIDVDIPGGSISSGSNVTIHINYPIEFLTLNLLPDTIINQVFPDDFELENTTVMRVE